jgi:hypothetical protein
MFITLTVMADVAYNTSSFPTLLRMLASLLTLSKEAIVIMTSLRTTQAMDRDRKNETRRKSTIVSMNLHMLGTIR